MGEGGGSFFAPISVQEASVVGGDEGWRGETCLVVAVVVVVAVCSFSSL